ncbi:MAG: hypothetical protein HQL75_06365 [Magnetococcales bacterium]|nr:hypothetical protein [Magnetococcales bacterium]
MTPSGWYNEAWKETVQKRAVDLEEGRTTSIPWAEARERLEHVAKLDFRFDHDTSPRNK